MKKLIILGGLALFLALLAAAAIQSVTAQLRGPSWAEMELERLAVERAAAVAPAQTLAAQALALFPVAVAYTALALAAVGGAAALARFLRRLNYEHPDAAGRLPVLLADQHTAQHALAAFHGARQLEAQRQPVPHSITYHAPHTSSRVDYRADAGRAALLPADVAPGELGPVPTFAQLLDAGKVGRGPDGRVLPLLLGLDAETGVELPGSWLDLYSTAVAGLPGAGKTTTQRFLACQTALMGAKFVVIDPHAEAGEDSLAATLEPLRAAYLCEAASDDKRILEAVRLVADIGRRRVKGRDPNTTPVILWADELTKLLGRGAIGDELGELLEAVAQEYRKKRVFVCGSGQIWTAARTGSELRDSFASAIVHRMKRNQARMLLPTEEAAQAERLDTGHAILWRTSGATATVAIPLTTGADVRRVAGLLGDGTEARVDLSGFRPASTEGATMPLSDGSRKARGSTLEAPSGEASSAPVSGGLTVGALDPATARILARFAAGATVPELVRELAGSTSGRKADEARAQVEAALRRALGQA